MEPLQIISLSTSSREAATSSSLNSPISKFCFALVVYALRSTLLSRTPAFEIKCASCAAPGTPYASGSSIGQQCYFIFASTGQFVNERPNGNLALGAFDGGYAVFNLYAA